MACIKLAIIDTDTRPQEVTLFPNCGTVIGIGKHGVSAEITVAYQRQCAIEEIPVSHAKKSVIGGNPVLHVGDFKPVFPTQGPAILPCNKL